MKYIAVLLTVHNRKEKTLACLKRLYSQIFPSEYTFDVYLTDDGCTDGTPEKVTEQFPDVHIIQGDGNLYWCGGMRKAWDVAAAARNYDYYFWLNDDTFLYDFALSELLKTSANHDDKSIIVGPTLSTDLKQTTYGIRMEPERLVPPDGIERKGDTFNGNIVLVPLYVYHIMGNIDQKLIHAGGDTEYGRTANEKGIDVIQTKNHLGECDLHEKLDKWCDPSVPIIERFKSMNSPKGMPLNLLFYQVRRHFGLFRAIRVVVTTVLHCAFPRLWMYMKNKF